jgi:hypothetical protein
MAAPARFGSLGAITLTAKEINSSVTKRILRRFIKPRRSLFTWRMLLVGLFESNWRISYTAVQAPQVGNLRYHHYTQFVYAA